MAQTAGVPQVSLAELDELVRLYQSHNLPLPPADASLVRLDGFSSVDKDLIACAYLVSKKGPNSNPVLWIGTTLVEGWPGRPVNPIAENASRIFSLHAFSPVFPEEVLLAMAVIERTRDHNAFALALLAEVKREAFYSTNRDLIPKKGASLENRMAHLALGHWMNAIIDARSDRSLVLKEIDRLLSRYPELSNSTVSQMQSDLRATVTLRYQGNDPDEKLIDALCDSQVDGRELSSVMHSEAERFRPLLAVVDRGFAMIPTLIEHLPDRRLTRAHHIGIMNAPSTLCTVGDVCAALLDNYRGKDTSWSRGSEKVRAEMTAWWDSVQEVGTSEYCRLKLANTTMGAPFELMGAPSEFLLRLAQRDHPDILPGVYLGFLNSSRDVQTSSILRAMEQSLPRGEVIGLALQGVSNARFDRVYSALETLSRLERSAFDRELVRALQRIPSGEPGTLVPWLLIEATFARLVAKSESQATWNALFEVAVRADLDLRIELIENSSQGGHSPKSRQLWLNFLTQFFDDSGEATVGGNAANRRAHFGLYTGRVQDLAVFHAAKALGLRDIPAPNARRQLWTKVRTDVEHKIKQLSRERMTTDNNEAAKADVTSE